MSRMATSSKLKIAPIQLRDFAARTGRYLVMMPNLRVLLNVFDEREYGRNERG